MCLLILTKFDFSFGKWNMASVIMASVTIMATVTYGKCYLYQPYYGKCNYGKSITANETEL